MSACHRQQPVNTQGDSRVSAEIRYLEWTGTSGLLEWCFVPWVLSTFKLIRLSEVQQGFLEFLSIGLEQGPSSENEEEKPGLFLS